MVVDGLLKKIKINFFDISDIRKKQMVFMISFVFLFAFAHDRFIHPRFWAEDGVVFFQQAYQHGLSSFIIPYAGYLHVIPRLVAYLTVKLIPYRFAPLVFNYSAVLLFMLTIWQVMTSRIKGVNKYLIALSLILVPSTAEILAVLTNVQWFLALLLISVFMREKATNLKERVSDSLVVLLCGLTGPFLVLMAPYALFRLFFVRKELYLSILTICIMLLQAYFIFFMGAPIISNVNVFNSIFTGLVFYYVLMLGILSIAFFCAKDKLAQNKMIAFIGLVLFFIVMVVSSAIRLHGVHPGFTIRYNYIPFVLFLWALLFLYADSPYFMKKVIIGIIASMFLWSIFPHNYTSNNPLNRFFDWSYYANKLNKGCSVDAPINPRGRWLIKISGRKKCNL